ncbi:hypothetical protein T4B_4898 [Trichinella pseudospiralis]|uniref:Uncharacterized protein n=2 Tax=Trichinella pseudospiralis TaxID=6337 RepID=A0A0V1IZH8_TRIPS|nr:hypothetical protein T4D_10062 [Trichinella pseudospiralis]KRZ27701.1 hypothetical protein T4B_4898 [Trichinella pseudospiralis]
MFNLKRSINHIDVPNDTGIIKASIGKFSFSCFHTFMVSRIFLIEIKPTFPKASIYCGVEV